VNVSSPSERAALCTIDESTSGTSLCPALRACFTMEMVDATALRDTCPLGALASVDALPVAEPILPAPADPPATTRTTIIVDSQRVNESIPSAGEWNEARKRVRERYTRV
jgi:hypothetical protein